jgi:hypothetical protein
MSVTGYGGIVLWQYMVGCTVFLVDGSANSSLFVIVFLILVKNIYLKELLGTYALYLSQYCMLWLDYEYAKQTSSFVWLLFIIQVSHYAIASSQADCHFV